MFTNMLITIIILMLSNIMMMLCIVLYKKSNYEREKNSPFECGFEPFKSSRSPFSLRFFLITIIFLIFDVEITLILPSIMNYTQINMMNWILINSTFIIILLGGLIHEWKLGILEWNKFN